RYSRKKQNRPIAHCPMCLWNISLPVVNIVGSMQAKRFLTMANVTCQNQGLVCRAGKPKRLWKCAWTCKDKYMCGIRGVHGRARKRRPFKRRQRRRSKKQRHLRHHASPLQTTPGENHSPASNTNVAQPAGIRQGLQVNDVTVFLTGLCSLPETATRTSRAAKPSSSDDCRFTGNP